MIHPFRGTSGKLRNGWWILLFYAVLAAILVPTTILLSKQGVAPGIPAQGLMVLVATAACLWMRKEHPRAVLGTLASWRIGVPRGLAGGALAWGAAALVLLASRAVSWHWHGQPMQVLLDGLADCVAVAIVEELLFRGFAFQRLVDGIGTWAAQLLMAGYFVLIHAAALPTAGDLHVLAIANIFLASLLFGTAYLRTRSLAIPVALHFALNFVQGPLLGLGVSGHASSGLLAPDFGMAPAWWTGGDFGLEASLPGTIAILCALLVALAWPSRPHVSSSSISLDAKERRHPGAAATEDVPDRSD